MTRLPLLALLAACAAPPAVGPVAIAPPPLALGLQVDGDVFLRGRRSTITVSAPASAGATFVVLAGVDLAGPGDCPRAIAPTCLDVAAPWVELGRGTLGATGVGTLSLRVPPGAPLGDVEVQAVALLRGAVHRSAARILPVLDPLADVDGDGLSAEDERALGLDPLHPDTDRDGLPDDERARHGSDPRLADSDGDQLLDGEEVALGLDPARADTDGGGSPDGVELLLGGDPLRAADDALLGPDADRDGLRDADEALVGADPADPDSDDDGLLDGVEVLRAGTDPLAADTDGGGAFDADERLTGHDPLDPDDDLPGVDDLLLVEVVDHATSFRARYVELHHVGTAPLSLAGWTLQRFANGATTPTSVALEASVVLAPGQSWVVTLDAPAFEAALGVPPSQASSVAGGDGDDAYALALFGRRVDVWGEPGLNGTGTPWQSTDAVVKRRPGVLRPSTVFDLAEWEILPGVTDALPYDRN